MKQLTIVGTEDGRLVLAAEGGERFTLPIDDVLRRELKRSRQDASPADAPRASPREVQAHIRSGLSAKEVAELLGTTIEDVERYEAPVLAEREHIVNQALAVPVLIGTELEPDGSLSFGEAIRAKLSDAHAADERWTSWKDENGWTVKLEFSSNEVEHDARWSFDPRRSTLSPLNSSATQLSRQGTLPEGLIPRLRALDTQPSWKDDSRFDSGAFGPRKLPEPAPEPHDEAPVDPPRVPAAGRPSAAEAAVKRAPEPAAPTHADTADLLEALRRRRGQREPAPASEGVPAAPPHGEPTARTSPPAPVALFDDLGDDDEIVAEKQAAAEQRGESGRRRGGRSAMPSWDEIVFGAKTED